MGFSIRDYFLEGNESADAEKRLLEDILSIPEHDEKFQSQLLAQSVDQAAESLLTELLKHPHSQVRSFCTRALWGIWFNERGEEAFEELLIGVRAMESEQYAHALKLFENTVCRYTGWAEPLNKLATIHYLLRRPSSSVDLCQAVLKIKPYHFGALNGLVYGAIQLKDWTLATESLKSYWKLCPYATDAREMDRIICENSHS